MQSGLYDLGNMIIGLETLENYYHSKWDETFPCPPIYLFSSSKVDLPFAPGVKRPLFSTQQRNGDPEKEPKSKVEPVWTGKVFLLLSFKPVSGDDGQVFFFFF